MVNISDDFSKEELEYYSRQIVLKDFGIKAQKKLKESKVCLVGVGGLGSPISIQLVSMGVGYLRIIDRDVVERSNLQRQQLYSIDMLGKPKVEMATDRLKKMNPFVKVEPVPMSLTPKNAENLIKGFDVVVDGLDSMTPRYAINRATQKLRIPYIFGGVITQVGNASTIIPGETACIECFQGNVDDNSLPSCSVLGVHPSIINIIASIQVSETIRLLTHRQPVLANKLLFCDLEDLSIDKIQLSKLESCPVCGTKEKSPNKLKKMEEEEICGRAGRKVFVFSPNESMDIDLDLLHKTLINNDFKIETRSRLGTTFRNNGLKGSILCTGVTIIEGVEDIGVARTIRSELFAN